MPVSNGHVVLARGSATTQSDGGKLFAVPYGHLYCALQTSNATPNSSGTMVTSTKLNPDSAYSEVCPRDSYMVENNGNPRLQHLRDISVALPTTMFIWLEDSQLLYYCKV